MSARTATAAVIGAGDYIGAAIARRFAAAGFTIYAGRRNGDKLAPLEVCIFNIGANVNFPLVETTERVFRKVWEMACYFRISRHARSGPSHAATRPGLLGPRNIHVAHLIIDAGVDTAFVRERIKAAGDEQALANIQQDELAANTSRSVERGTFGAPTFFVGDEIYFGKERLRDVEEAIVAARTLDM